MKKFSKEIVFCLTLAGPIILIIYLSLDHFGVIDKITNQDKLIIGINRLESTAGYPTTWLYNDFLDDDITKQVFKLIWKNSTEIQKHINSTKIYKEVIKNDYPILISTAGSPIKIQGIDEKWDQKEKCFFSENHPILFVLNSSRNVKGKGSAIKVCTLGDLKLWAKNRKETFLYWIGGIAIGFLSIAIVILQFKLEKYVAIKDEKNKIKLEP